MDWLFPSAWWALVVVAGVAAALARAARARQAALRRFAGAGLLPRLLPDAPRPGRRALRAGLAVAGLAALVAALAGPRTGADLREVEREGVDLFIALDVSASMRAEDVAPNRLARAKNEVKKLLSALTGDRVGLIVFAGDAFVQCPLTTDYNAVRLFLEVAAPEQMPTPGTNFRLVVDAARRAFDAARDGPVGAPGGPARGRALLLVSDGEAHVGAVDDVKARADEAGIRLFTAGVGETGGARIPEVENGRRVGFKRDRQGALVQTRLEEAVLRDLAAGGAYFRIARTSSALADLPAALAQMEQTTFATDRFASYDEHFQWPLALSLVLLAAATLVPVRPRRATP